MSRKRRLYQLPVTRSAAPFSLRPGTPRRLSGGLVGDGVLVAAVEEERFRPINIGQDFL
jgi:hypothetical protein